MTAASQHDFHPDAELLNAFAEQALAERERSPVLAHLAGCGRCREVVALAQQAAMTENAPASVAAAPIPPDAWWSRWRIIWIPATVAAAFTVASISVYLRQADHSGAAIRVAEQPASQNSGMAPAPSQAEFAESVSPAAPPPPAAAAPTRSFVEAKAATPTAKPVAEAAVPRELEGVPDQAAPSPSAAETVNVAQDRPDLDTVAPSEAPAMNQLAQAGSPAVYKTPPAVMAPQLQKQTEQQAALAEQQKQIEAAVLRERLFTAEETPQPRAKGANGGAVASASGSAASYNQQAEMRAGSAAALSSLHGTLASREISRPPIYLPSGLAVTSFASAGRRGVAIDTAGAVFVRQDVGSSWKLVKPQWTGRAILVRTETPPPPLPAAAPVAANDAITSVATPSNVPPAAFFEIVNDKNQIWQSTDGAIWTAK